MEVHIRFVATGKDEEYKAWLADGELEGLRRAATIHRHDLVLQLGGYVGCGAFELPMCNYSTLRQLKVDSIDSEYEGIRLGMGGKLRDIILPVDVENLIQQSQNATDIVPQDLFYLIERRFRSSIKLTVTAAPRRYGGL